MRAPTPTPAKRAPLFRATEAQRARWDARGGERGPLDDASAADVLTALRQLRDVTARPARLQRRATAGAELIVNWLASHQGSGWQDRWERANPDDTLDFVSELTPGDPPSAGGARVVVLDGLVSLLLIRFLLPSHRFLRSLSWPSLYVKARTVFQPELFARAEQKAEQLQLRRFQRVQAMNALTAIVLHSGRDLDKLTFDDFMNLRHATGRPGGQTRGGISIGWDLARGIAQIPDTPFHTMRLRGQLSTSEIVDAYNLACRPVRDVIIRYMTNDGRRWTTAPSRLRPASWPASGPISKRTTRESTRCTSAKTSRRPGGTEPGPSSTATERLVSGSLR